MSYAPAGAPSAAPLLPITAGASPYSYKNTSGTRQNMIVTGGTVTLIAFSRDGVTFYSTGLIAGCVMLNPNDICQITYTVAPVVTAVPI